MAYDNFGPVEVYRPLMGDGSRGAVWFDNYDGEEVILMDNYVDQMEFSFFLQFLDRQRIVLQLTFW